MQNFKDHAHWKDYCKMKYREAFLVIWLINWTTNSLMIRKMHTIFLYIICILNYINLSPEEIIFFSSILVYIWKTIWDTILVTPFNGREVCFSPIIWEVWSRTSPKTVSVVKQVCRNSVKVTKKYCCWMVTTSSRWNKKSWKVPAKLACSRTNENLSGLDKTWLKSN